MKSLKSWSVLGAVGVLVLSSGSAWAQGNDDTVGAGQPSSELPTPRSDNDPRPPVASPMTPNVGGVVKQAGVGGPTAYGRTGVVELGGSAGFSAADNYTRFELSPSVGYFVADNLQMSVLGVFNYFNLDDAVVGDSSATEFKLLLEPSYHLPFSNSLFGFLGLGAGANYISEDVGFAVQPRLGVNVLVGRSGVLTPAFNVAYSTVDAVRTGAGTLLAVRTTYGVNIGYTVMW